GPTYDGVTGSPRSFPGNMALVGGIWDGRLAADGYLALGGAQQRSGRGREGPEDDSIRVECSGPDRGAGQPPGKTESRKREAGSSPPDPAALEISAHAGGPILPGGPRPGDVHNQDGAEYEQE